VIRDRRIGSTRHRGDRIPPGYRVEAFYFKKGKITLLSGTDVMIFKIFSPKKIAKKLAFFDS
jgi:hypothetical protein